MRRSSRRGFMFRCALAAAVGGGGLLVSAAVYAHALDQLVDQQDIGLNKIPNRGTSQVLVIPGWIGGSYPSDQLAALRAYFAHDGGPGTFRQYWLDQSGGRYDPIPTVVEPVEYPDSCPIPSRDVDSCTVSFSDTDLILGGELAVALGDFLSRVRDEQNIDLAQFDVNGRDGAPDGYFDGVLMATNVIEGVAPPLASLTNETIVETRPGGGGTSISLSVVAMIPPPNHEYAHLFGFMDLYNGPPVNCLMAEGGYPDVSSSLGAYNRQQIGWGEVRDIVHDTVVDLPPVLDGGPILRIGSPPRYVLIENRGGALHSAYDHTPTGVYAYSIDEAALPVGALGFLESMPDGSYGLYLPNLEPPYLDVALPVNCNLLDTADPNACAMTAVDQQRALIHGSGDDTGFTLRISDVRGDGTIAVELLNGVAAPAPLEVSGGCALAPPPTRWSPSVWLLIIAPLWRRRASRRP